MLTRLQPKAVQAAFIAAGAGALLVLVVAGYVNMRRRRGGLRPKKDHRCAERRRNRRNIEYDRIFSDLNVRQSIPDQVQAKKKEDIIILHELQLGESYMVNGNFEEGTRHLANAVSMYSNPEKFLRTLKGCLDPAVYKMLLNTLVNGNGARSAGKLYPYDPFEKYTLRNAHYYLPK